MRWFYSVVFLLHRLCRQRKTSQGQTIEPACGSRWFESPGCPRALRLWTTFVNRILGEFVVLVQDCRKGLLFPGFHRADFEVGPTQDDLAIKIQSFAYGQSKHLIEFRSGGHALL